MNNTRCSCSVYPSRVTLRVELTLSVTTERYRNKENNSLNHRGTEQSHKKTYLLTCAPSEDSNHPAYPRSLIRFFVVRMNKLCILGYRNACCGESDQTVQLRRLILIIAGRCSVPTLLTLRVTTLHSNPVVWQAVYYLLCKVDIIYYIRYLM